MPGDAGSLPQAVGPVFSVVADVVHCCKNLVAAVFNYGVIIDDVVVSWSTLTAIYYARMPANSADRGAGLQLVLELKRALPSTVMEFVDRMSTAVPIHFCSPAVQEVSGTCRSLCPSAVTLACPHLRRVGARRSYWLELALWSSQFSPRSTRPGLVWQCVASRCHRMAPRLRREHSSPTRLLSH